MAEKIALPSSDYELAFEAGVTEAAFVKESAAKTARILMVPRDRIRILPGFNARLMSGPKWEARVGTIAASIAANGFYSDKPLDGKLGKDGDLNVVFLTGGYTRLAAIDSLIARVEAGEEIPNVPQAIPVMLKSPDTTDVDLTVALVNGNDSERLDVLETAIVVGRLKEVYSLSPADIAGRLGFSEKYVGDLLTLAGSPKAVREMVAEGVVAPTLAIVEVTKNGGKDATSRLKAGLKAARAAGKDKLTAKFLPKPPKADGPTDAEINKIKREAKAARDAAKGGAEDVAPSITVSEVLAIATSVELDASGDQADKLLTLAATIAAHFGGEVVQDAEPAAQGDLPLEETASPDTAPSDAAAGL